MRWLVLLWIALIVGIAIVYGQPRAYTLAIGRISPTELEQQKCYFPVGNAASINLHPGGEPCVRVRELIGKTGTLLFVVDEP